MLYIILLFILTGTCCDTDRDILESISKSERQFYTKRIVPESAGHKVNKTSYRSIVKRKTSIREQVLAKIKEADSDFSLGSFDTFYLAEGADGAYGYGFIWSDSLLISYSYDPLKGEVSTRYRNKNDFFKSYEGSFLNAVDNWGDDLKQKPIWSNPSLMGGLCYFVTKIDLSKPECTFETIGLYEFR